MTRVILVLAISILSLQGISAATVRDMFVKENKDLFNLIPQNSRLDILDYYDSGRVVSVENLLGNGSELINVKDNFISVKTSSVSTIEMFMSAKSKNDSVIIINKTVLTPVADSEIEFYDTDWNKLNAEKYFKTPTLSDFVVVSKGDKKTKEEVIEMIDISFISYAVDAESGNIKAAHNLDKFLSKEDYNKIKPYLKDSISYEWTGKKYKELK